MHLVPIKIARTDQSQKNVVVSVALAFRVGPINVEQTINAGVENRNGDNGDEIWCRCNDISYLVCSLLLVLAYATFFCFVHVLFFLN